MISRAGKWIHIDICSTGGTSRNAALLEMFPDAEGKHHSNPNVAGDQPYCTPVTDEEMRDFFKFAVVRHPCTRIAATYYWTLDAWVAEVCQGWQRGTFNARLRLRPQTDWVEGGCRYIGKFEEMDLAWLDICLRLNMRSPLPKKIMPALPRENSHSRGAISSESEGLVREFYRADFEAFGYG